MGVIDRIREQIKVPWSGEDSTSSSQDTFTWSSVPASPKETVYQQQSRLREELTSLQEEIQTAKKIKEEAWAGGTSYDPDMYLSPQGGGSLYFNRLSQSRRDLNPVQQERALELAYLLYESNPLGKSVVEITRDFVLGDSVGAQSTDPTESRRKQQQDIIDDFWADPINLMDLKLPNKVMELGLWGEQCYPVEVNDVNGHVRLGYIDPGIIKNVFLDPRNVERPLAVITYVRKDNQVGEEQWWRIIQPEEDPASSYYGRLTVFEVDGRTPISSITWKNSDGSTGSHSVEGSCFYFSVNKVSNAGRGRSDLLCLIDWIDAYDQLLFGEVDRGLLLKAFIWDVKLTGYSDTQIEEYKKANPQPRPGSVRYHNEKVDWEAETPDLKAADSAAAADLILGYISTGARIPKTWLNGTLDVNKATAQELGTPALARLGLRQQIVRYMIVHVLTFVLDQAEMKGQITKRAKRRGNLGAAPWPLQIALPDLKTVNQMAAAQAFNNVVVGAATAVMEGFIDIQLAQDLVVMLIKQMGIDVNITALRQRLEENPPPAVDPTARKTLNSPPPATELDKAKPSSEADLKSLLRGINLGS